LLITFKSRHLGNSEEAKKLALFFSFFITFKSRHLGNFQGAKKLALFFSFFSTICLQFKSYYLHRVFAKRAIFKKILILHLVTFFKKAKLLEKIVTKKGTLAISVSNLASLEGLPFLNPPWGRCHPP